MTIVEQIAAEFGVGADEVAVWVERRWVLPTRAAAGLAFSDADRARCRMIAEFRRDLAIDDEAMPVVLDLVDRLHAARAELRRVLEAVAELPKAHKDRILSRLLGEDRT
jgi:chaperone modulatory protein CbpM